MDSTVKITQLLPDGSTTNTNALRTSTRSMAEPGNGFVTATSVTILCVSNARKKVKLFPQLKFTTRFPSQRAALMQERI